MDTIMKNILKTLALGLALVVAASCDLSEYNPNEYGAAMAYGSESNIRSLLYSFYSTFPSLSGAYSKEQSSVDYMTTTALSSRFQSTFTADEAAAWGDWDDLRNINLFLTQIRRTRPFPARVLVFQETSHLRRHALVRSCNCH